MSASPPTPPIGRGGRTRTPTPGCGRRPSITSGHDIPLAKALAMTSARPRYWDRHLSRRPREREPSCRGTSPSLRRANHDEQDRVDSDVRCNPVDSIGSSTESRVSRSEPPAFCSVSEGQRRLGEKEHRACSVTPGVALRVRTQAAVAHRSCPHRPALPCHNFEVAHFAKLCRIALGGNAVLKGEG